MHTIKLLNLANRHMPKGNLAYIYQYVPVNSQSIALSQLTAIMHVQRNLARWSNPIDLDMLTLDNYKETLH